MLLSSSRWYADVFILQTRHKSDKMCSFQIVQWFVVLFLWLLLLVVVVVM